MVRRFSKLVLRCVNSPLCELGFQVVRIPRSAKQSDPVLRLLGKGISTRKFNSVETMDIFYSDQNILAYCAERADFYDDVCGRLANLEIQPKSVLDVGCGSGHLLAEVRKLWPNACVRGVDFSSKSIDLARRLHPDIAFEQCSIFDLNHLVCRCDLIICTEVLEHLEAADRAIDQLYSICRPEGWIVITVPDGRSDTFAGHFNFWTPESFCREFRRYNPIVTKFDDWLFIIIRRDEESRSSAMVDSPSKCDHAT
jgi:SAM-dependent methyltransferase